MNYNNNSLLFIFPGLLLQCVGGSFSVGPVDISNLLHIDIPNLLSALIYYVGMVLLFIGYAYYAKAKGRSVAWCLCAFLSCIGFIILAFLNDKSGKPYNHPIEFPDKVIYPKTGIVTELEINE